MEFGLFILVIAIMLVRPTDFIPALQGMQLYLVAISACLVVSFPRLMAVLSPGELVKLPVGVFMLAILGVSVVSNLGNGNLDGGMEFVSDYGKLILLFFLLVAIVDTPSRLRTVLKAIVVITLIPVALALLHFNEVIEIPAYVVTVENGGVNPETGRVEDVRRLGASGSFGDPNDVTEIINVSLMFLLSLLLNRRSGLSRFIWLIPAPIFVYALILTKSRGGLLGLLAGISVLMTLKLGRRRALLLGGIGIPVLLAAVGGRQASISASHGTGQSRIQLWDAAFEQIKLSPLIGVGTNKLHEFIRQVAHNSWIQAGAELGLIGGALYFGIYYYLIMNLIRGGGEPPGGRDPELAALRPFLLAGLGSYTMNEMSLTHPFTVFTYVMAGLGSAWIRMADRESPISGAYLSGGLLRSVFVYAFIFFTALYMLVQFSVNYR